MRVPRGAIKIYKCCLQITVNRSGKNITYNIPENKKAAIYGLTDGEILIRSQIGSALMKGAVKFRGFCKEIRAKKDQDSLWPGELFKHSSPLSSKNAVYAVGKDIFIKSLTGKSLWKIFEYSDGTGTRQ